MGVVAEFDAAGGTKSLLDVSIDGELEGGQSTNHEETGTHTGEQSAGSEFSGNLY